MQPANHDLLSSVHGFDLDQYRSDVLAPLEARWTDYLSPEHCRNIIDWLETSDPEWSLLCGGPPRCGKVSEDWHYADDARLTIAKTTFAATLLDGIRDHFNYQQYDTAIVTLLLTARHFPAQPSADDVLLIILRAVLRQLLGLAFGKDDTGLNINAVRTAVSAGLNLNVTQSLVKSLLCRWCRSFLILDDISDIPALDMFCIRSRLVEVGLQSIVFVGSPLNTLTYGGDCFCDVEHCARRCSILAECEECNRCHCARCYRDQERCCAKCVNLLRARRFEC